jgi:heme/copper-type cytochrome/quinol oxidase subunit 4
MNRLKLLAQRFVVWARVYFQENWGAPFVLGFIATLLVAATCLTAGLSWQGEQLGVLAYFYLVVGVALQLVCFWKLGQKKGRRESEVGN